MSILFFHFHQWFFYDCVDNSFVYSVGLFKKHPIPIAMTGSVYGRSPAGRQVCRRLEEALPHPFQALALSAQWLQLTMALEDWPRDWQRGRR